MKKTTWKHADFFQAMDVWAPKHLAYDWDNVGLQIGTYNAITSRVLITLDVTEKVVDEAIEKGINLIIAHHPLLFQPLKQINMDTPKGRTVQKLIKNDITVYASHTNLDAADGGVNDMLAKELKLIHPTPLVSVYNEKNYKVVIYVPTSHLEKIRQTFADSGAGHIGNYSHCTFQSPGQGTFKPLNGTNPYIGEENKITHVDEYKVETIVPESKLSDVIMSILHAHPYEEPAYDIYALENETTDFGIGRIGNLTEPSTLDSFIQTVKTQFQLEGIRISGNKDKIIKRVAILGGSGERYVSHAMRQKADVYITGDMTFHMAQDAAEMGLTVIDAGHYIEKIMKYYTKQTLAQTMNLDKDFIEISEINTDPFQFV
ncbi:MULTISPECIES: Nif3-like dinuclear metal center hexameric protein [Oceanobacillus]|uniref:GTP cyclohydrolase 1 type 2 homolog n=1 Tax=Oceanobacillus kimchii TaxID=746691 RepID=A0ABQ5TLG4_9BACI|nr:MULTISPECIES: Nif3-like dinuclear metal center hexameric protein [Oceanobacillus]MBT2598307.1 Nif3-like dinuclear metal center hexameric protein [Oceanobacillus sp. ISL-74]MBT2651226.1 Nif3-like dinuclear metal center hexameric protein [Oceanobacillus sp. ISL-73]MCT1575885.1 Nif3-like dinuclear metal center hexameric protein [Oceanobacillus kimchii]MCT2135522.1 Nif3-like dinuclear metal center hexameric protein [Oceanobacillus kimchii]OEH55627.1 Nif3-like dinuclear metal center hexameric pr